jgi:opacity protein-like surface antigen
MVIGLEYDFNWTSAKDTKEFNDGFFSFAGLANFKFDYFASARARMGLAFDNALVYVTAGPAWGHFDSSVVLGIRDPVSPTVNQLSTDKAWHMIWGSPRASALNICSQITGRCGVNIFFSTSKMLSDLSHK